MEGLYENSQIDVDKSRSKYSSDGTSLGTCNFRDAGWWVIHPQGSGVDIGWNMGAAYCRRLNYYPY